MFECFACTSLYLLLVHACPFMVVSVLSPSSSGHFFPTAECSSTGLLSLSSSSSFSVVIVMVVGWGGGVVVVVVVVVAVVAAVVVVVAATGTLAVLTGLRVQL